MRISPSDIRLAITNPNYRVPRVRKGGPSPDGTLRKAIRVFHTDGLEAAMQHIEQGLSGDYWRQRGLTQAKSARQMLDTYVHLAGGGSRMAAPANKYTLREIGHDIAADVDVLLPTPDGYIGRVCFTGAMSRVLTPDERALVVAAPFRGLCEEFEDGLLGDVITGMQLWELRFEVASVVTRAEAEAAWPALIDHIRRATSE